MNLIIIVLAELWRPVFALLTGPDHALQDFFRARGTSAWYVVLGMVESVELSRGEYMWRVTLAYSYPVDAERRPGETFRLFAYQRQALRYAEAHPVRSIVAVRYGPGKPEASVVLKDDQRTVFPDGSI
ncbi:MAG: hypothetical protein LAO20_13685 [Acidobacteriia bacterium]|nr:hypothetical protein [Terriglobia bacterium]